MFFSDPAVKLQEGEENAGSAYKVLVEKLCGEKISIGLLEDEKKLLSAVLSEVLNGSVDCAQYNETLILAIQGRLNDDTKGLAESDKKLISTLLSKANKQGLDHAQFNELMLLINQERVSEAFFNYFFGNRVENLKSLEDGIVKFRGYAFLCFGNIRFAYKKLIKTTGKLEAKLGHFGFTKEELLADFSDRQPKTSDIERIKKEHTWLSGYISKGKYDKEAKLLSQWLNNRQLRSKGVNEEELLALYDRLEKFAVRREEVENRAKKNTDIYLSWDHLDVYISTSMRNSWEFEETSEFSENVFKSRQLQELNLRYFDPTQSYCDNRLDKGLVEGLMLKRARCNIYMAQEYDTMGKDSELAATLAQGKPVIAYVPEITDVKAHEKKIISFPLDFHRSRCLMLTAERILEDRNCVDELGDKIINMEKIIKLFQQELDSYRDKQPFTLWDEREKQFKKEAQYFKDVCKYLAILDKFSYDKRAKTLEEVHPLSMQVHLETGVANGLMVVRSARKCSKLLRRVMLNDMDFDISHVGDEGSGAWTLDERISECPFRVITDSERITNSFWNYYL